MLGGGEVGAHDGEKTSTGGGGGASPQTQNVCLGELAGGGLGKTMSEGEDSDGGGSSGRSSDEKVRQEAAAGGHVMRSRLRIRGH